MLNLYNLCISISYNTNIIIQVTVNQIWQIFRSVAASVSTHSRLIRQLHAQQRTSASQDEWMDLAEQIDNIQGNDIWRTEKKCALYEMDRIQARIDELVSVFSSRVCKELLNTYISSEHINLLHVRFT